MKRLLYGAIVLISIVFVLVGVFGIPALIDSIKKSEDQIVEEQFATYVLEVNLAIRTNLTALEKYLVQEIRTMDALYNAWINTGFINREKYEDILPFTFENTGLSIQRSLMFKRVRNVEEFNNVEAFGRQYYNKSDFRIFNVTESGPVYLTSNFTN